MTTAPVAPASPDVPLRSAPEADFDAKMYALFKWLTDDIVGFMESWRAYLATNSTIVGDELNATSIGQTTPAAGSFTSLSATSALAVGSETVANNYSIRIHGGHANSIRLTRYSGENGVGEIRHYGSGALQFVTSDGADILFATNSTARVRIGNAGGHVTPVADNAQNFGSATKRWNDIFATNTVIQSSDRTLKQGIRALNLAERRVATRLLADMRIYQWITAVEEKGEDAARLHCGFIAQDVAAAFTAEGLDPGHYGLFVCSPVFKTVIASKEVERQKVEELTVERVEIEVIDGRAVQSIFTENQDRPVWQELPLFDEAGTALMERVEVDGGDGQMSFESRQRVYHIPVLETVTEEYEKEVPNGERLGLRYVELLCFLMAVS